MRLEVAPPDVNRSYHMFTTDGERTIVYGLGAIKGVGEAAIESIVAARGAGGRFADLFDFCRRVELKKVNRRVIESLIRAGALDGLGANRATLMIQLPLGLKMAEQYHAQQAAGQDDLFGMAEPDAPAAAPVLGVLPDAVDEWDEDERLQGEKETLGLFLTGHPIDFYEPELGELVSARIGKLSVDDAAPGERGRRGGRRVVVAGLVIAVNRRNSQKGAMAGVVLDDKTGRIEATLFNENYERYRDLVATDRVLVMEGTLSPDEYRGGVSLRVDKVSAFEECRVARLGVLELGLDRELLQSRGWSADDFVHALDQLLRPHCGGGAEARLRYAGQAAQGVLRLGPQWRVRVGDELLRQARRLFGNERVGLRYGPRPADVQRVAVGL
jgi:DNA polymerase-3 subunit alpha